jgi:hypothetical protein
MKRNSGKRKSSKSVDSASSRRRQRFLASLAAASAVGSGSIALGNTATTLTGLGDTNQPVPVNHGSNAEVTLTWDPNWDQYADWDGRGDVYQLDERIEELVFSPTAANIKVTIQDFFLDEWAGGTDTSAMWSVIGSSSGVLASGTWTDFNNANDPGDAGGRSLVTANATGALGETLTLLLDHSLSGGYISYLAMDNLTFLSMVIPEPATGVMAWLGIGGLGAMAMRRKRA